MKAGGAEFRGSLGYLASSRPAWTPRDHCLSLTPKSNGVATCLYYPMAVRLAGSLDTERQAKLSRDDPLYSKVSNRRSLWAHGVMLGGASAGAGRGGHGGAGGQLDRGREGRRPRGGAGGSGPQVGGAAQVRSPSARPRFSPPPRSPG